MHGCHECFDDLFSIAGIVVLVTPLFVWLFRQLVISRRKSRQAQSVDAEAVRAQPTVLYLRPFSLDESYMDVGSGRYCGPLDFSTETFEQRVVKLLDGIGPVIAIGKPGERMPPLGAQRLYVEDGDWQRVVVEYSDMTKLIVIVFGETVSLEWEIETILRHHLRKLFIILPVDNLRSNLRLYVLLRRIVPSLPPEDAVFETDKRTGTACGVAGISFVANPDGEPIRFVHDATDYRQGCLGEILQSLQEELQVSADSVS